MATAVWVSEDGASIYVGRSSIDGLAFRRERFGSGAGYWRVSVDGWVHMNSLAVVDDFGNLVQVPA